jgi:putative phosphoribosyl transferase
MRFRDRTRAGEALARRLAGLRGRTDLLVLGLPRGGVPVAARVAGALGAPLDVLVVRKLGVPGHEELALGAIASGGFRTLNDEVIAHLMIPPSVVESVTRATTAELAAHERRFRGDRPPPLVAGHTVILVDDGLATGATMTAAVSAVRAQGPRAIIVAVPVAPSETCAALRRVADEVVALLEPESFWSVGAHYEDFEQVGDAEVRAQLAEGGRMARREDVGQADEWDVKIPVGDDISLDGELVIPIEARGVVVFAHGSGSSRHSPRNRAVAAALNAGGLGTLLLDLLSAEEERQDSLTAQLRFDISLLALRLARVIDWLAADERASDRRLGLFGGSTGAAAALVAAAQRPARVAAVVSRGGRPDLAKPVLPSVRAPTLLIVGGHDFGVLGLNREALASLGGDSRLVVVPGATHLFEEQGALEEVTRLALSWFRTFLSPTVTRLPHGEPMTPGA